MATEVIKDGDYVIVKTETTMRLIELKKNKPQFLGKRKALFFAAMGHPYGTFFEIKSNGSLVKLDNPEESHNLLMQVSEGSEDAKDNRDLIDTGDSQKLTTSDIEAFKKSGMSGHDMVKKIVENSNTFHEKTAFAKEKYLRKKQKKYLNFVQILKPNIRLLAEMYYMQGPLKICNLRIDSLSQMLAFCNVMSGGKYMVLDTALGLLTAAVVERLGSSGCVVQLHLGPFSIHPNQQVIKALNLPLSQLSSILYNIDFKSVVSLLSDSSPKEAICGDSVQLNQEESKGLTANPEEPMAIDTTINENVKQESKSSTNDNPEEAMLVDKDTKKSDATEAKMSKSEKKDHIQKTKDVLKHKNMDSLLVATKNHPLNALLLLDFLAYSRPFCIFSMYQQPLVDCYVKLKSRGDVIALNITETWLRQYQVLPNRTHPFYNMSGSGGYLLTGIRVAPKP